MSSPKQNQNDFSKIILNLSISLLLVAISTFAIIGALNAGKFIQFAKVNIQEVMEYHKTAYESSVNSQNKLKDSVSNFLNAYSSVLAENVDLNKSIRSKVFDLSRMAEEALIYLFALGLGSDNMLSTADVNSIVNTTLEKINGKSERWGKIFKAANKQLIYDAMRKSGNTSYDPMGSNP